jgi:hypothetical protein
MERTNSLLVLRAFPLAVQWRRSQRERAQELRCDRTVFRPILQVQDSIQQKGDQP